MCNSVLELEQRQINVAEKAVEMLVLVTSQPKHGKKGREREKQDDGKLHLKWASVTISIDLHR